MAKKKLEYQVPKAFAPLFERPKRKTILRGGRGSGKSHQVGRYLVQRALTGTEHILCTRELQKTIADSVHTLLQRCIEALGVEDMFVIQKNTIYCPATGSDFIFAGVRANTNEIKSMEGVTICWIEEAQSMSQQSLDVLIPTIRAPGSILIFTFNPFKDTDPVYVMAETPDEDTLVIDVNFWDNPFFPDELRREMELTKRTDYDKYLWVWEGKCLGISAAQIFRGKYEVAEFETPANVVLHYGADWGFANDPTTVVRSFVVGNTLYIDEEAWGLHVDIADLPPLFNEVEGTRFYPIYADSARPETISAMQSYGYNVLAAEKWQGSVEDGISYLRSFDKIVVHPRCKHIKEEFDLYQYKVDPQTEEILRVPVDRFNHCIDALRYSYSMQMRADHNGKMYSSFTNDNIVPTHSQFVMQGSVAVGTFTFGGKTWALGLQVKGNNLVVAMEYERQGALDFKHLAEQFPAGCDLVWFPLAKLQDVAGETVTECQECGFEPAVGVVLPAENEATLLVNQLFKNNSLYVFSSCALLTTSLTARTYMAEGKKEKTSQMNKTTYICMLFEYLVWRVFSRLEAAEALLQSESD